VYEHEECFVLKEEKNKFNARRHARPLHDITVVLWSGSSIFANADRLAANLDPKI
jgi:uncharacterized DUF497 family protein